MVFQAPDLSGMLQKFRGEESSGRVPMIQIAGESGRWAFCEGDDAAVSEGAPQSVLAYQKGPLTFIKVS